MNDFFNPERSDRDLIYEMINEALVARNTTEKVSLLLKIQEILIRKNPHLIPEVLPSILNFITEKAGDIKKTLVGFIEELCKVDESLLPKVMLSLHMLLCDESIVVQKRLIQATISIYRKMLSSICKAECITEEMDVAWKQLNEMKSEISNMIDSDNDGIRTSTVKFLECVVLLQSYPDPHESNKNDFSLEDVPLTLKIARRRKLEEEANITFDKLIKFNGSPHISSANLFVCIGALTNIAKSRPDFMEAVIQSLIGLSSNFPPTLSTTQVSSVKKKLKFELAGLIKHPAAFDYVDKLSPLLVELGYSQNEVTKLIPKVEDRRKYTKRTFSPEATTQEKAAKKPRLEFEEDPELQSISKQRQAMDLNENFIKEKLTNDIALEIVLKALYDIPTKIPPTFKNDYGETLKLGDAGEIKILSKLLAEQFLEQGIGPGSKIIGKTVILKEQPEIPEPVAKVETKKRPREEDDKEVKTEKEEKIPKKEKIKAPRIKILKLNEITRPLDKVTKEGLLVGAVKRLLMADKQNNTKIRQKIITTVAASFNDTVRENVLVFVIKDIKTHLDLALSWLYEEYSIMQGFSRIPELRRSSRIEQSYSNLISSFVSASSNDEVILSRLLLEAPIITDQVLEQLSQICRDQDRCNWATGLLTNLVIRRPTRQLMFLKTLLEHTTYEDIVIRECTLEHVIELHKRIELRYDIEQYVKKCLEYLTLAQPPENLFGPKQGRLSGVDSWNEDIAKACLEGYVAILPSNPKLIHELTKVYVQTGAEIKRVILRLLEIPIRVMGMDSAELLKLVEDCPKGSETLVTRVIHILTDKGPPSMQLVQRVRELYNTRVSDVRFLIPVLNGLSKNEITAALPKLIKLNPVVVREVFNRLLGAHGDSSISPTELLVALHVLSTDQIDIKAQMKAITMCLNEKLVFTQEVLAVVLQQLMEQTPLPTLMMRTVIQGLGLFPRLSGFVMNILQRLILKQVWKQKVAWEGFVKCCQRTKPQSFSVLMQLPPSQLSEALDMSPDIREPLKEHLLSFTESQRGHVPAAVQDVLLEASAKHSSAPIELQPASVQPIEGVLNSALEPLPPGME